MTTARILVFVFGLLFFIERETKNPKRMSRHPRSHRFAFHIGLATLNSVLLRLLGAGPLFYLLDLAHERGFGIVQALGLSGWIEVALSLVLLDLANYFWHRMNHRIPMLWAFHKVHHSDTDLDTLTSLRFHPGEFLFSFLYKTVCIVLVGPSMWSFGLFETLVTLAAQFHHANIALPSSVEGSLRKFIITPKVHLAHHTVTPWSRNGNYSTILTLWDFIFGTFRIPEREDLTRLGLEDGRRHVLDFFFQLKAPFTKDYK